MSGYLKALWMVAVLFWCLWLTLMWPVAVVIIYSLILIGLAWMAVAGGDPWK